MEGRNSGPHNRIHSMKKIMHPRAALFAAILAVVFPISGRAQIVIGTGPDASYAVIQATGSSDQSFTLIYEYRYNYDPSKPLDGYDLLTAIDSALPELNLNFITFGEGSTKLFPQFGHLWHDNAYKYSRSRLCPILGSMGARRRGGVSHCGADFFRQLESRIGGFQPLPLDCARVIGRICV